MWLNVLMNHVVYYVAVCINFITETQCLPFQLMQTPMCQDAEQDQQTQDVREDSIASKAA